MRERGSRYRPLAKQFARFIIAGLANTGITFLLFEALRRYMPYLTAYSISYVTGVAISYLLNAKFVFERRTSVIGAVLFPLVYAVQYGLGLSLMWLFVDRAGLSPTTALLAVTIVS